jgi:Niemann-Pick C1 protein
MALVSIGLGVVTSFGLCSLIGLSYGPMHSLIPCLLVGLGVDNAFVLVQAVQNVNEKELGEFWRSILL